MDFPAWFFECAEPRIPVKVTRFLPIIVHDDAGNETGKMHWRLIEGRLFMSQEAFAELKRIAQDWSDARPIKL